MAETEQEKAERVAAKAAKAATAWAAKSKKIVGASLIGMFVVLAYLFVITWAALPNPDATVFQIVSTSEVDSADVPVLNGDEDTAAGDGAQSAGDSEEAATEPVITIAVKPVTKADELVVLFGAVRWVPDLDVLLIMIVGIAGALGSVTYGLRAFGRWSATGWRPEWIYWYLVHPAIGMVLAVGVYLLLRGGLVSVSASTTDINAYGVAGLGFLVGFASRHLALWLQKTAQAMFPVNDDDDGGADPDADPAGKPDPAAPADPVVPVVPAAPAVPAAPPVVDTEGNGDA